MREIKKEVRIKRVQKKIGKKTTDERTKKNIKRRSLRAERGRIKRSEKKKE